MGLSAEFAHPVEYVLGNILPFGVPCAILGTRMHFFTYIVIGTSVIVGTTVNHSGYDLPWLATELYPLRTTSRYHDYHHKGNIDGNFCGSTIIYDLIFGYSDSYFKHLDKSDGADRKVGKTE